MADIKKSASHLAIKENSRSETQLERIVEAVSQDDSLMVEEFLKSGGDANSTCRGRCLLHWCAQESSINCGSLLIDWGARMDEIDPEGHFPLFQAAAEGSLELVQFLIDRGAPLNQCSTAGTALGIACAYERMDVIQYLVSKGADPELADEEGASPISIARDYESPELMTALKA